MSKEVTAKELYRVFWDMTSKTIAVNGTSLTLDTLTLAWDGKVWLKTVDEEWYILKPEEVCTVMEGGYE